MENNLSITPDPLQQVVGMIVVFPSRPPRWQQQGWRHCAAALGTVARPVESSSRHEMILRIWKQICWTSCSDEGDSSALGTWEIARRKYDLIDVGDETNGPSEDG